jgi:single stranded DNA-binding protein
VLLCKGTDANDCLTEKQVAALKQLYAGAQDVAGHQFFPAFMRGGEDGAGAWSTWITGTAPGRSAGFFFGNGYFSNFVYEKADWDYKTFNLDQGLKLAETKTSAALDSVDPNLKAFMARGGKLIMYHGWNDPGIPPENTINYYQSVVTKLGVRNAESFMKLFMVPGMRETIRVDGTAYLTRDPEIRYTPKGTAVCEIGMAINRNFTAENGEKREEVTFVDVTLWGRQAEIAGEYLKKGRPVFIEGRLQLDTWDDKTSGQKRSKLKVVGEGMQLIGSRDGAAGGGGGSSRPPSSDEMEDPPRARPSSGGRGGASRGNAPAKNAPPPEPDDDEIPF